MKGKKNHRLDKKREGGEKRPQMRPVGTLSTILSAVLTITAILLTFAITSRASYLSLFQQFEVQFISYSSLASNSASTQAQSYEQIAGYHMESACGNRVAAAKYFDMMCTSAIAVVLLIAALLVLFLSTKYSEKLTRGKRHCILTLICIAVALQIFGYLVWWRPCVVSSVAKYTYQPIFEELFGFVRWQDYKYTNLPNDIVKQIEEQKAMLPGCKCDDTLCCPKQSAKEE